MYAACASGHVDPAWKVDKPMTCPEFCQRLAEQQCKYRSAECKYPGDSAFWSFTQLNKVRQQKRLAKLVATIGCSQVITYDVWREAKFPRGRNAKSRLCSGNIEKLREHLRSLKAVSVRKCQVCNRDCYWKCMLCPDEPAMCLKQNRKGQSFTCAFHFHNNDYFGLCMPFRFVWERATTAKSCTSTSSPQSSDQVGQRHHMFSNIVPFPHSLQLSRSSL